MLTTSYRRIVSPAVQTQFRRALSNQGTEGLDPFRSKDGKIKITLTGTGPIAAVVAAQMFNNTESHPLEFTFLTARASYKRALENDGITVHDKRNGNIIHIPSDFIRVKNPATVAHDESSKLVIDTTQLGQARARLDNTLSFPGVALVLSIKNGETGFEEVEKAGKSFNVPAGHGIAYLKANTPDASRPTYVECNDGGILRSGPLAQDAKNHALVSAFRALTHGPLFESLESTDVRKEAKDKAYRNITNVGCLVAVLDQYSTVTSEKPVIARPYGYHLQHPGLLKTMILITLEAMNAKHESPTEAGHQVWENLKYVAGPQASHLPSENLIKDYISCFFYKQPYDQLATTLVDLIGKIEGNGSSHPPTDAQKSAWDIQISNNRVIPQAPIENKLKSILEAGRKNGVSDAKMKTLIDASTLFDSFNHAVRQKAEFTPDSALLERLGIQDLSWGIQSRCVKDVTQEMIHSEQARLFQLERASFVTIQDTMPIISKQGSWPIIREARAASHSNARVLYIDGQEGKQDSATTWSPLASNIDSLGENSIPNSTIIKSLMPVFESCNVPVIRGDVGGVSIQVHPDVKLSIAEAVQHDSTFRYSPGDIDGVKSAATSFFNKVGDYTFSENQVMLAPMRSKLVLPWLLPLIDKDAELITTYPGYNPTAGSGISAGRKMHFVESTQSEKGFMPLIDYAREMAEQGKPIFMILATPGNPISRVLSKEESDALAELLHDFPNVGLLLDEAYRGYQYDVTETHNPLKESLEDKDPKALRLSVVSRSKLLNYASGSAVIASNPATIKLLQEFTWASATQPGTVGRMAFPSQVKYADWQKPRLWKDMMDTFTNRFQELGGVSGLTLLKYDSAPFITFDVAGLLKETDLSSQELQHYCLVHGLSLLVGGFGLESQDILRIGITSMNEEEAKLYPEKLVTLLNDTSRIKHFKDVLTRVEKDLSLENKLEYLIREMAK